MISDCVSDESDEGCTDLHSFNHLFIGPVLIFLYITENAKKAHGRQ